MGYMDGYIIPIKQDNSYNFHSNAVNVDEDEFKRNYIHIKEEPFKTDSLQLSRKLFTVNNCDVFINIYKNDLLIVIKTKRRKTNYKYLYISLMDIFANEYWKISEMMIQGDFEKHHIPHDSYASYLKYMRKQALLWIDATFIWCFITALEKWDIQRFGNRKNFYYYQFIFNSFVEEAKDDFIGFVCNIFLNDYKSVYDEYMAYYMQYRDPKQVEWLCETDNTISVSALQTNKK